MKNRTIIGIVCIILAVAITFGVSPMINKMTEGKTQVVVLSKDIAKGARIADGDLTTVELSKNGIPDKAVKDKKDIVDKYANSDIYKGDIATAVKFSDNANSSDNILSSLGKDKVAMSITIALLCQKRFPIDFKTSLMQAGQAFPIVVYTHKLENNERKIMDISECEILPNGDRKYHTLFRYHISKNERINGKFVVEGYFEQPEFISANLQRKLLQFGVPQNELAEFLGGDYA